LSGLGQLIVFFTAKEYRMELLDVSEGFQLLGGVSKRMNKTIRQKVIKMKFQIL